MLKFHVIRIQKYCRCAEVVLKSHFKVLLPESALILVVAEFREDEVCSTGKW